MTEAEVIAELESVYEALDILELDTVHSNEEWLALVRYYRVRRDNLEVQLTELRKGKDTNECGL